MEDDIKPQPTKNTYPSCRQFTKKTRELLREEERYEIQLFDQMTKNKTIGEIQALGYGLAAMSVVATKRGFYGKTILTLTKTYHSQKNPLLLPEHCKIQVGDDVALFRNNTIVVDGVVSKKVGPKLYVSIRKEIDDDNDLEGLNCNVVLKWNEVTFRRYFRVLDELDQSQSPLLDIFFQSYPPSSGNYTQKMDYESKKLNEEQNLAVAHCLKETVHLLHGPPGTGKTTTVCELIIEAVKRKEKVLACGPSNIAVDNIVEGLSRRVNCVRIGNPARMIENVIQNCLDYLIAQKSVNWKNQEKKLQNARKRLGKASKQERRGIVGEIRQLRDEIFYLQQQAIQQILDDVDVICCTNVGAFDRVFKKYIPKRVFDLVVIDQCGQSLEVACWIPILKGRRVVLAGDHKQLPPTIQGNQGSLLSYTLFSRAMEELANIASTMLKVQYRMNNAIMGWSNRCFYDSKLKAHQTVENHKLQHLCNKVLDTEETLLMIDTSGCGMGEEGGEKQSKMNVGEADIALSIYKKLLTYDVSPNFVAILTPYSKQVAYIKTLLTEANVPLPDISTVDGIQGREKECIIISLVRSNSKQEIGFLKDWRRMNVAVTRARRMLILIGNAQCASADKNMASLIHWIEESGHISSAEELRGDQSIRFGLGASDKIQHKDKKLGTEKELPSESKNKPKKKKKKEKEEQQKPQYEQHGVEEQASVKQHYRKVFSQILREITINNVTSFERKMIHEIAQEMGFCHETSSDKKYIKVWKKLTNDEVAEKYAELERLKMEEDIAEAKKKEKQKLKRENREAKNAKTVNSGPNKYAEDMKKLVGQQQSSEQEEEKQAPKPQDQKIEEQEKVKEKPKKKKNRMKEAQKEFQEQNIEEIMKEFAGPQPKENECFKCNKRITSVTAAECKFCKINYCRYHVLAEEHGCGIAASEQARGGKKTFDKHLQQATERLKQKIKDQEQSRKRKGKESKK